MLILGVNFGHDASVCIIQDGKIIAAIEEEKVSRIKQDFGWPRHAISRLFEEHHLQKEAVDIIAFNHEIPSVLGKDEILYRFTKKNLQKSLEYINRITSYLKVSKRKIGENSKWAIADRLKAEGYVNAKVVYFDHHLSHAASAYYTAPIETNLVITCDGHGGNWAFNYYKPTEKGLEMIRGNDYTVSVGAFYSMITKLLGFRPNRHEGKITGLAAFGQPTALVDKFRALFYYEKDELRRFPGDALEAYWDQYKISDTLSLKEKINLKETSSKIASDYARRAMVILAWLKETTKGFSKEDIAYACQLTAEEVVLEETRRVLKEHYSGQKVICALAGGVFANVRINQKIYELPEVENVFVHPAMGDAGLGLGNAVLADIEFRSKDMLGRAYEFENTYLGPDYTEDLRQFVASFEATDLAWKQMAEPAKEIAQLLADHKIVGFWQGSMEWGPRALGRRTIMLNTFNKEVNDILNTRLSRTEFMPFAPVVLDKMAQTYFPAYDPSVPAADYMTITYDTDEQYHDMLQATVHVDGTARPQIAYQDKTPLYYSILEEFYNLTGCGALVNTSFNAHEEPILSSPETAIRALRTNRVDVLIMEDYMFKMAD